MNVTSRVAKVGPVVRCQQIWAIAIVSEPSARSASIAVTCAVLRRRRPTLLAQLRRQKLGGDLQRRYGEVKCGVPGRRETETVGWDGYDKMAQIRWQTSACNPGKGLPLRMSHPRTAAYPWLRSNGTGHCLT